MTAATLTHRHESQRVSADTSSARRADHTQDQAHYHCGCGTRFTAPVSTSVDCPACGCGQTW